MEIEFSNPVIQWAVLGAGIFFILLILMARAATNSDKVIAPLEHYMSDLGQRVQALGDGQERLAGGLNHVSEAQAQAQANMLKLMEQRLAQVQQQMNENLHGTARRTAQSLGDLQQRLVTIDKASYVFYTTQDLPSAAWTEEDNKVIFAMKKGLELKITGESTRGTVTNDIYTLKGFTASYNKLTKDC